MLMDLTLSSVPEIGGARLIPSEFYFILVSVQYRNGWKYLQLIMFICALDWMIRMVSGVEKVQI